MSWLGKKLRCMLGLDADMLGLARKLNYHTDGLNHSFMELQDEVAAMRRDIAVSHQGLGRLIAKLDPMYGRPEAMPDAMAPQSVKDDWQRRKVESDKLGEQTIARIYAEDDARKKAEGYPSGSQGTR